MGFRALSTFTVHMTNSEETRRYILMKLLKKKRKKGWNNICGQEARNISWDQLM
jgi:hypothetical protein